MGPSLFDVLWSIGLFLGAPTLWFLWKCLREWRRVRRQRREWQAEDQAVHEEGFAPGPPLGDDNEP